MKVNLTCAGVCRDNGKPTQIAGCGVIIEFVDDHDRRQYREFGWALGCSTANLADIQAARLALSSVLPQFRGYHTTLRISSRYVFGLLSKDRLSEPKKNKEEIAELRRWFGYYESISVAKYDRSAEDDVEDKVVARVNVLARNAMGSQQHFDSGTVGLEN